MQETVDSRVLREYSLFPGQVVAMEGVNTSGRKLVASKLSDRYDFMEMLKTPFPYIPSDGLTFDPLVDVIVGDLPDVCILLGPFVDSKHEQIEKSLLTKMFDAIFSRCVGSIVKGTEGVGCRFVFVPPERDVHHHFIYPQPPFTLPGLRKDDAKRVTLVPDTCTLLIEGVTLGLTSTDILSYMGAEEISCHDVLIVSSELRLFIKDVIGCVCVNPGCLTKGQVGGTYGRLLIQRSSTSIDGKRVCHCDASQVVKI
ncbi:DNA polymerase alpha subunit B-like [Salvelinus alpinus]